MDEELVTPGIQRLEGFGAVHVVHEDTTVGSAIEGNTEGLKTLLSGCVPELEGNDSIIDGYFLGQEVGANSGLVGGRELLVDLVDAKSEKRLDV